MSKIFNMWEQVSYKEQNATRTQSHFGKPERYIQILEDVIPVQPYEGSTSLWFNRGGLKGRIAPNQPACETPAKAQITYTVSDSSVRNGHGMYGCVEETHNVIMQSGVGMVLGPPGTIMSFRLEAQGLTDLVFQQDITRETKVFLDNTAVIGKVTQHCPLKPLQAEWELLEPMRKKIQEKGVGI